MEPRRKIFGNLQIGIDSYKKVHGRPSIDTYRSCLQILRRVDGSSGVTFFRSSGYQHNLLSMMHAGPMDAYRYVGILISGVCVCVDNWSLVDIQGTCK